MNRRIFAFSVEAARISFLMVISMSVANASRGYKRKSKNKTSKQLIK